MAVDFSLFHNFTAKYHEILHLKNPKCADVIVKGLGLDHVQVNWKHKSIGNISQLETRPLIG